MKTRLHKAALIPAALAFTGCSSPPRDAASEAPVKLEPGNYRVTMAGSGVGMFGARAQGPGTVDENLCVIAAKTGEFPTTLARKYFSMGEPRSCSHVAGERTGNAFSGTTSCRTDPERAPGGSMNVEYQGALSTDRVDLEGKLKMNLPKAALAGMSPAEARQIESGVRAMENVAIVLTAERTGECQ